MSIRNPPGGLLPKTAYLVNEMSTAQLVRQITKQRSATRNQARVATGLRHRDLPKLEEAGILEYDTRNETIRYHSDTVVEDLLDCLGEHEGRGGGGVAEPRILNHLVPVVSTINISNPPTGSI